MWGKVKGNRVESCRSQVNLCITRLRDSDLNIVLDIEKTSFSLPWSRGMFLDSMRNREVGFHYGAWIDGDLKGYVIAWRVIGELHIGNLAVKPEFRRRGAGEKLIRYVLERFWAGGGKIATLEVRLSNDQAISLYHKLGFHDVAIRRGYYHDNNEDAVVMILYRPPLEGSEEEPDRSVLPD